MNAIRRMTTTNRKMLLTTSLEKDGRSRLGSFCDWLDATERTWYSPDLVAYRDHLLMRLAPTSTATHLATIRAHYQKLLRDNHFIALLYQMVGDGLGPADHKAMVDELIRQIQNAIDPANAPVQVIKVQDVEDDKHLRLTVAQANHLMTMPRQVWQDAPLRALAETAAIALLLCTGIREAELCALDVEDLRQQYGGRLALRIRKGKRCKQRLVPYGDMAWVLILVDKWLVAAEITDGAVFQGFTKGNKRLNGRRVSTKWVERLFINYPVSSDSGKLVFVEPHDLRRTYARRLYEAWVNGDGGLPLEAIQQNMGHEDPKTTLGYIGTLDAGQRSPGQVFTFDLSLI